MTDKTKKKWKIQEIDIEKISLNPKQPRKKFDENTLQELAQSIQEKGILQPILVHAHKDGFQLIAGERRLKACKLIKKETIPAIITVIENNDLGEIGLTENLQREDLSPIEEANALSLIMNQYQGDLEKVASCLGKTTNYINKKLSLLNLPGEVQKMIECKKINLAQAEILIEIENPKEQLQAAEKAIHLNWTANQLRGCTQNLKRKCPEDKGLGGRKIKFPMVMKNFINIFDILSKIELEKLDKNQRRTLLNQIRSLGQLLNAKEDELIEMEESRDDSEEIDGENLM